MTTFYRRRVGEAAPAAPGTAAAGSLSAAVQAGQNGHIWWRGQRVALIVTLGADLEESLRLQQELAALRARYATEALCTE